MGLSYSVPRIEGIGIDGRDVRLSDILDKHKDLQHMMDYMRKFMDHHMELQGNETNYQTEIFYARNIIALVKPYAPRDLHPPEFVDKPPSFDGIPQPILDYEFQIFITHCMEYFSTILSSIDISN